MLRRAEDRETLCGVNFKSIFSLTGVLFSPPRNWLHRLGPRADPPRNVAHLEPCNANTTADSFVAGFTSSNIFSGRFHARHQVSFGSIPLWRIPCSPNLIVPSVCWPPMFGVMQTRSRCTSGSSPLHIPLLVSMHHLLAYARQFENACPIVGWLTDVNFIQPPNVMQSTADEVHVHACV